MPSQHVSIGELKSLQGGSLGAHQALVDGCLRFLALKRIPARAISTTGVPVKRADGSLILAKNERQEGFPDIVGTIPPLGRALLVECKTGEATRTPAQRRLHSEFAAAGALCLVVREVDDLIRAIGAIQAFTHHPRSTDRS